jgi:hypothetical protein
VWDIKYHVIRMTKYRILRGGVAESARDVIRQICQLREVTSVRGPCTYVSGTRDSTYGQEDIVRT